MIEAYGDFWGMPARVKCITTNGDVNAQGLAVMGRGVAKDFAMKFPQGRRLLGDRLKREPNEPHYIISDDVTQYWSFPVKHHWQEKADLSLIYRSAQILVGLMKSIDGIVLIPRPGCGNGGLRWEHVKPVIAPIFRNDRYVLITKCD